MSARGDVVKRTTWVCDRCGAELGFTRGDVIMGWGSAQTTLQVCADCYREIRRVAAGLRSIL